MLAMQERVILGLQGCVQETRIRGIISFLIVNMPAPVKSNVPLRDQALQLTGHIGTIQARKAEGSGDLKGLAIFATDAGTPQLFELIGTTARMVLTNMMT